MCKKRHTRDKHLTHQNIRMIQNSHSFTNQREPDPQILRSFFKSVWVWHKVANSRLPLTTNYKKCPLKFGWNIWQLPSPGTFPTDIAPIDPGLGIRAPEGLLSNDFLCIHSIWIFKTLQQLVTKNYNKIQHNGRTFFSNKFKAVRIITDIVFWQPCSNVLFLHGWTALVDLGLLTAEVARSHSDTHTLGRTSSGQMIGQV